MRNKFNTSDRHCLRTRGGKAVNWIVEYRSEGRMSGRSEDMPRKPVDRRRRKRRDCRGIPLSTQLPRIFLGGFRMVMGVEKVDGWEKARQRAWKGGW